MFRLQAIIGAIVVRDTLVSDDWESPSCAAYTKQSQLCTVLKGSQSKANSFILSYLKGELYQEENRFNDETIRGGFCVF